MPFCVCSSTQAALGCSIAVVFRVGTANFDFLGQVCWSFRVTSSLPAAKLSEIARCAVESCNRESAALFDVTKVELANGLSVHVVGLCSCTARDAFLLTYNTLLSLSTSHHIEVREVLSHPLLSLLFDPTLSPSHRVTYSFQLPTQPNVVNRTDRINKDL